ncbi:G2/M phase-specific E3 ubiquitin-protein ligase-like [Phlebotomus papatasi]|uniref:G2/M phase-specific E3 ubiquitin-protein ligase-like n=1 Tax=Phlebotomus papatasi TaxID=29031 RepID=UPI0024834795|nr:G2/M phase-specific E3 ubiquitin-protein ligase-like [Phlebotomus papatasi]
MTCYVCRIDEDNSLLYGPIYTKDNIKCHYYCLLFGDRYVQRGEDHEGILGFLVSDIKHGAALKTKALCTFCKKPRAATKCAFKNCYKKFHFICGLKNGCLYQFDEMLAFCNAHTGLEKTAPPEYSSENTCVICSEVLGPYSPLDRIQAHCQLIAWMHTDCVRRFALNAGYGFKCLLCRKTDFRSIVQKKGVFVPQRETEWIISQCEGGSQDPSSAPLLCGAKVCRFPGGRKFLLNTTIGETCHSCNRSVHPECVRYSGVQKDDKFICFDCHDEDIEIIEPVEVEEKNQDIVMTDGAPLKKYLGDVYAGRKNYVADELLPNFYGPRCADAGKFRLNYFFNSH